VCNFAVCTDGLRQNDLIVILSAVSHNTVCDIVPVCVLRSGVCWSVFESVKVYILKMMLVIVPVALAVCR